MGSYTLIGPHICRFSYEFDLTFGSRLGSLKSLYEVIETLSCSSSPETLTSSILSCGEPLEPEECERDLDWDLDRLDWMRSSSSSSFCPSNSSNPFASTVPEPLLNAFLKFKSFESAFETNSAASWSLKSSSKDLSFLSSSFSQPDWIE